jgi:hypothetical protein
MGSWFPRLCSIMAGGEAQQRPHLTIGGKQERRPVLGDFLLPVLSHLGPQPMEWGHQPSQQLFLLR